MILTDDNFATIVRAVEYGRELYDNLSKYIRFQMAALVGFIATFLGAAILSIADGIPFSPLAVLWINFVVQVPDRHRPRVRQAAAGPHGPQAAPARPSRCSTSPSGSGPSRSACSWPIATLWVRDVFEEWADALGGHDHGRHGVLADERGHGHERPQPDPHGLHPRHRLRPSSAHPLRRDDPRHRARHRARRPQPDPRHHLAHRRPVARLPAARRRAGPRRGDHQARPAPAGATPPTETPHDPVRQTTRSSAAASSRTSASRPGPEPTSTADPRCGRASASTSRSRRRSSTPPPRTCSSGASSG